MIEEDILGKAIELLKANEIKNRNNTDSFNIFSILGMERKELSHSAFIYALLNSEGLHNKDHYCLRKFIEVVMGINIIQDTKLYVRREAVYFGSRIDLLIGVNELEYAIEIKVDDGEQPLQIERYYELTSNTVYYLTLDKRSPTSCSEKNLENVKCISFGDEIVKWLNKCKIGLNNPFDVIILQYINLLTKLTNKEEGDKVMMELIKGRESYKAVTELTKIQTAFKTKFLTEFFHKLQNELEFATCDDEYKTCEEDFANYYAVRTYPYLRFELNVDREKLGLDDEHAIFFYIKVDYNLYTYVSIRHKDKKDDLIQDFPEEYIKLKELFKNEQYSQKNIERYNEYYFWNNVLVQGKKLNFKDQSGIYMQLLAQDNDANCMFDVSIFNSLKDEIVGNYNKAKKLLEKYLI